MGGVDSCGKYAIAIGALLACCSCAFALDSSLDITQYAHTAWTIRDGYFNGIIFGGITQTPDGYLWLGTEFGLVRFDGVRFVPWQPPAGQHLEIGRVRALLAARDGRLWIGGDDGLASWKGGQLIQYPQVSGSFILSLLEDREGTVWTAGAKALGGRSSGGRLCAIQNGNVQCFGEDGSFGDNAGFLYEDRAGNLWTRATAGLRRWKPGPPKLYPMPGTVIGLSEDDNGALLISTESGVRQLVNEKLEAYRPALVGRRPGQAKLFRDRDGGLWIQTTDRGLIHVHQGRTDFFGQSDGLSGDFVQAVFEDREGSIWVATGNGLDRFRAFAIPTVSVKQGLSNALAVSVLAARDGSVWVATVDGINRFKDGQITIHRTRGGLPNNNVGALFEDDTGRILATTAGGSAWFENGHFIPVSGVPRRKASAIAGDRTEAAWISYVLEGLFHLVHGNMVEQITWDRLKANDYASVLLSDPSRRGLWLGFRGHGLEYFSDGQVRASYSSADGLGEGQVNGLQLDPDSTLWAATHGGLSRVKDGRIATLSARNGLPCDTVHWSMEDNDHAVWLYMACGLVRIARTELNAWAADPKRTVQSTVFDSSDGVRVQADTSGYTPRVAKSADGRIWFLPFDGVSVIDPRHMPMNKLPPPVHIEEVKVDGKVWDASHGWRLPALAREVTIHYTALSFVAPEKVHFRRKLEGQDPNWTEVVNDREVQYTNLKPRNYRFRVMASNNSGVWNEAGDALDFSIAPAWYQATWFLASCVAASFVLLWGLHRYRLHQLARRFDLRMEERVGERTRIARDLHDTLLQSFQGVLLKFSAVSYKIPENSEARADLEEAIDQARDAVTEGRDAVQGLRSSTVVSNDLARSISLCGEGLAREQGPSHPARFHVQVEGESRDLPPLVRDEVYRIALEALRNSFRHSEASQIEVEIRYDPQLFTMRVRDNGKGIDPQVLETGGRADHHGLPGMHERASLAGGSLAVWSKPEAGTEIELTISAAIAYRKVTLPPVPKTAS